MGKISCENVAMGSNSTSAQQETKIHFSNFSETRTVLIKKESCTFYKDSVMLRTDPSVIPKANFPFHLSQLFTLPSFCSNPVYPKEIPRLCAVKELSSEDLEHAFILFPSNP